MKIQDKRTIATKLKSWLEIVLMDQIKEDQTCTHDLRFIQGKGIK